MLFRSAGQTADEAAEELFACIRAANAADDFLREHPATVEITGARFSSGEIPSDHPLADGLLATIVDVSGRASRAKGVPYGADMRLLIRQGGTPTVMYGPGDVRQAHAPDERVPLADVVVHVVDGTAPHHATAGRERIAALAPGGAMLEVWTRADLHRGLHAGNQVAPGDQFRVSAITGEGIQALRSSLQDRKSTRLNSSH